MQQYKKYTEIINDIYFYKDSGKNIALKHRLSESRISQIKRKISQLRYQPKIKDNKIVCYLCETPENLIIHHNHTSGEQIAVLCQKCNMELIKNPEKLDETSNKISDKREDEIKIRVTPSLKENIKLMSNGNMSKFIINCIEKADTKDYCIKGLYEIMVNNMKPVKKLTEKEMDIIKEIEEMLNV